MGGLRDRTPIVFNPLHGEDLGEHGPYLNGQSHYADLARVPRILAGPGTAVGRWGESPATSRHLADRMPTLKEFWAAELAA